MPLTVAIIGCGKIADQHAEHLQYLPGWKLIAVCDREPLMAAQLQERYRVPNAFGSVDSLLSNCKPDAVLITTPPQSHYPLAAQCMEAGCHVLVEKPFTVTYGEAEELVRISESKQVLLTVGHYAQFSHAAREMRSLVKSGYLGGDPLHMESYYCYDLGDPAYARALLNDPYHWVRTLPGGLLQNTISHGISKIAEFLSDEDPQVVAHGFTSSALRGAGETGIVDELRTIIRAGDVTAYFTFSSQMRPTLHHFRLFGPKNGLLVDESQQTVVRLRGKRYKSHLERFLPALDLSRQYFSNFRRNVRRFLRNDLQEGHGMRELLRTFQQAIERGGGPPIPYPEILRTSRILDRIFDQLGTRVANATVREQLVER